MIDADGVLEVLSERADAFNALREKKIKEAKKVFSNMKKTIEHGEDNFIKIVEEKYEENPYATLASKIRGGDPYTQEDIDRVMFMEFPDISVEQLIAPFIADKKSNCIRIMYGKVIQILLILFVYMTLMWKLPDIQLLLMVIGVVEICTNVREYLYPILKDDYEDESISMLKQALTKIKEE